MAILKLHSKEKTIIKPKYLFKVVEGKLSPDEAVVIEDGKIINLINKKAINNYLNENYKLINLSELTLMPGLIDCHVHFALDGESFQESIKRWDKPEVMMSKITEECKNFLEYGVVAVRDGSDKALIGLKAKKLSSNCSCLGPIIHACGYAIRKEGYYGTFLGEGLKDLNDIKKIIRELVKMKINHLKVLASGIVSFNKYKKIGPVQFNLEELKIITEEAHNYGLRVMAHASSDEAVRLASMAGIDSVEHGYFVSDSTLEIMAEKGTYFIPTVVPLHNLTLEPWRYSRTDNQLKIITTTYSLHLQKIKKAQEMGVRLAVGTDAGAAAVPHGKAYYDELALYKRAGLSNLDILRFAIENGAKLLGVEDTLGDIEAGKLPYLIAVKGNPLENINILKKPELVFIPT